MNLEHPHYRSSMSDPHWMHYWNYGEGDGKKIHITPLLDERANGFRKQTDEYPYTSYCGQVLYDPLPLGIVRDKNDQLHHSIDSWHEVCKRCSRAYQACAQDLNE